MRRLLLVLFCAVLPGCYGAKSLTCAVRGIGKYGVFVDSATTKAECTLSMNAITGKFESTKPQANIRGGDLACVLKSIDSNKMFEMHAKSCITFSTMYTLLSSYSPGETNPGTGNSVCLSGRKDISDESIDAAYIVSNIQPQIS